MTPSPTPLAAVIAGIAKEIRGRRAVSDNSPKIFQYMETWHTSLSAAAEQVGKLETEVTQLKKILEQDCKDWAETDTDLREMCRPFVKHHEEWGGYRIPVEDVVREAITKLQQPPTAPPGVPDEVMSAAKRWADNFYGLSDEGYKWFKADSAVLANWAAACLAGEVE